MDKQTGRKDSSSPGARTSILTDLTKSANQEVQMKLLRIDSSARAASVTRQLTARATEEWKKNHADGEIIHRDLSAIQIPPITDDWGATRPEASQLTPAQRAYLSTSDRLIGELRAADTIIIGAPMYNFSISSLLKAWIDQIVRIGRTLGYGPDGPHGLLEAKNVYSHHGSRRRL
jgi:FMN-dependent NADH-azoreductase